MELLKLINIINQEKLSHVTSIKLVKYKKSYVLIVLTTTSLCQITENSFLTLKFENLGLKENIHVSENLIIPINEEEILIHNDGKYYSYNLLKKNIEQNIFSRKVNSLNPDLFKIINEKNLCFYDEGSFKVMGENINFSFMDEDGIEDSNKGRDVIIDDENKIWVLVRSGVFELKNGETKIKRLDLLSEYRRENHLPKIVEFANWVIVCDYYGGIYFIDKKTKKVAIVDLNTGFHDLKFGLWCQDFRVINNSLLVSLSDDKNLWTAKIISPQEIKLKKLEIEYKWLWHLSEEKYIYKGYDNKYNLLNISTEIK